MSENFNQSDGISDAISGTVPESQDEMKQTENQTSGADAGGGSQESGAESGDGPENIENNPGDDPQGDGDNGDNGDGGDDGQDTGDGKTDSASTPSSASQGARPLLQSVMSLCVSMIEGAVKEDDFAVLMDAIVAREKILELERQIESERAGHKEELERLRASAAEELERKTAEAYAAGEIAGRNARIEESLRAVPAVPALGGTPAAAPRHLSSIFDLAATAR